MGTTECRFQKFKALPPPIPAENWGEYAVNTIHGGRGSEYFIATQTPNSNTPPMITTLVSREIAIVGSVHMGVEPFTLTAPLAIRGEPSNEYDSTALVVLHDDSPIGYIPRAAKHWLAALHPSVINSCKEIALVNNGDWCVSLWLPAAWVSGYYACNKGDELIPVGTNPRERNWWSFGWNSARLCAVS